MPLEGGARSDDCPTHRSPAVARERMQSEPLHPLELEPSRLSTRRRRSRSRLTHRTPGALAQARKEPAELAWRALVQPVRNLVTRLRLVTYALEALPPEWHVNDCPGAGCGRRRRSLRRVRSQADPGSEAAPEGLDECSPSVASRSSCDVAPPAYTLAGVRRAFLRVAASFPPCSAR
jgi:hypothetical protein